ncbi:MAG: glutamine synthetase family protein [Alphaproteobacteria bacterium]
MKGTLDLKTLRQLVDSGEIDTVLTVFPDQQGRLLGKRVVGRYFLDAVVHEAHACDYLLATDLEMDTISGYKASSWEKGYGDFVIKPDLSTLRRIPWLESTALVIGDCLDHHGHDLPHAPRSILKKQVAKAKKMGFVSKMASELEFYIFDDAFGAARTKDYKGLTPPGWYNEDYHIFQTTKEEPLIRAIRNGMEGAAVPVEFSKGECGFGQAEINLRYAEVLEMADRHSIYKNGVKEIAFAHGKSVTFMAKWDFVQPGSSCHIHNSLWDAKTGKAVFFDKGQPHGMSKLFQHYLAGQLALAREMSLFLAPTINSYKRYQAGSFAPTKAVWSNDNRTAGFRLCGEGKGLRIECRVPGADANPYLAFAALLAAGLHGIEQKMKLEPMAEGNLYVQDVRQVPTTLREAIDALDGSKLLRKLLGDDVIDHYLHTARIEQGEYDQRITDWELRRYFERV